MTTITFDTPLPIRRSRFKDEVDFYTYLKDKMNLPFLTEVSAHELSPEILHAYRASKRTTKTSLRNL